MKRCLAGLLFAGMLFLASQPSQAATVTLGGIYNRPISFEDVLVNGTLYDVNVMWDISYDAVYASKPPLFYNPADYLPSLYAVHALADALDDISYTGSYYRGDGLDVDMFVPFGTRTEWIDACFVDISTFHLVGGPAQIYAPDHITTPPPTPWESMGWTVWTPVATVPIPSAIWLLGSAMIGLVGLRRKFRKI